MEWIELWRAYVNAQHLQDTTIKYMRALSAQMQQGHASECISDDHTFINTFPQWKTSIKIKTYQV